MILKEILSKDIKICTQKFTSEKALKIINAFKLSHIPIIENNNLTGNISEECLTQILPNEKIINAKKHFQKFHLYTNSTIFETFNVFHTFDTNIIPILNNKEKFVGVVLMDEVVSYYSKFPFFTEEGRIIILETPFNKYSLTEISKIVESNNAKFYGILVTHISTEFVQIAIKISGDNITSIGETFERFGYVIINKLYTDKKHNLIEERYDQLIKYMNI